MALFRKMLWQVRRSQTSKCFLILLGLMELSCAQDAHISKLEEHGISNDPRVITLLYGKEETGNRVIVMDLSDAERIDAQEGRCSIVNLTAKLISAESCTTRVVTGSDGTRRIHITLTDGVIDAVPCYSDNDSPLHKGIIRLSRWTHQFAPLDMVRFNGKVMTAEEFARRFPILPVPAGSDTEKSSGSAALGTSQ